MEINEKNIGLIFRKSTPERLQEKNIAEVRNNMVDITLIVLGVFAIPPLVSSLLEVKTFGWDIDKFSQIGAVAILFILLSFRNKISFKIKALTVIGVILILGCTSLISRGIVGTGSLFFMISVILATLFFGSFGGMYALIGTIISYLSISILIIIGVVNISLDLEVIHGDKVNWTTDILLFALFSGIIIFTAGKLNKTLYNNINALNQRNRELEEEVNHRRKVEKELIVSKEEVLTAYHSKNEFLTNMSHEIRTPLHAITGFTDMIEKDITDKKHKSYLESIKSSSLKLLKMITTILDLSALETGKFKANFEFIEADSWFSDVMNLFKPSADDKNLIFISEISQGFPALIYTDKARITTVLSNLTENAIKFTEKGHVKIFLESSQGTEPDHKNVVIAIEDTGIGIPEELLNEQVPNFTQEDGKSNRKYEGIGLGLSLSRKLIEMLDGTLEIRSQIGKGTTITVRLPEVKIKQVKKDKSSLPVQDTESMEASYDISETSAEKIRTDTIDAWEKLKIKQPMEDVLAFGQRVKAIGEEDDIEALADYGRNLCESVEQYDIDNMLKLLKEYSLLLEKFKIL